MVRKKLFHDAFLGFHPAFHVVDRIALVFDLEFVVQGFEPHLHFPDRGVVEMLHFEHFAVIVEELQCFRRQLDRLCGVVYRQESFFQGCSLRSAGTIGEGLSTE